MVESFPGVATLPGRSGSGASRLFPWGWLKPALLRPPEILPEPHNRPVDHIPAVLRIREQMPFVRIDDKFCWYPQRLQRVPEFIGLRRRALAISISHYDERRRLRLLDKIDWGTLRVDHGIVRDRRAEIRNHPLIDFVFAVVAQIV